MVNMLLRNNSQCFVLIVSMQLQLSLLVLDC